MKSVRIPSKTTNISEIKIKELYRSYILISQWYRSEVYNKWSAEDADPD